MRGPRKEKRRTRGLSKFKRTDLTRAAQATIAAGLSVREINVDPVSGKIHVLVGEPAKGEDNELDTWLGKKDARSA